MKYLLSLFLLLAAYGSQAQTTTATDSLQKQINELRLGMSQAGTSLVKFQGIFMGGVAFTGIGMGCTVAGVSMMTSRSENDDKAGNNMTIFGVGLAGAGLIMSIVAHKHIKDAGIKLQGNGIAIPLSD